MAFHPMKPETAERRRREHEERSKARTAELRRRLAEKAEAEGPGSIWAEMVAEMDAAAGGGS